MKEDVIGTISCPVLAAIGSACSALVCITCSGSPTMSSVDTSFLVPRARSGVLVELREMIRTYPWLNGNGKCSPPVWNSASYEDSTWREESFLAVILNIVPEDDNRVRYDFVSCAGELFSVFSSSATLGTYFIRRIFCPGKPFRRRSLARAICQ